MTTETTGMYRAERRQRSAEDLYGERLITSYSAFPFAGPTFAPAPNVIVVRDLLTGRYSVLPWGVRINIPFRHSGYVFNLGLIRDHSEVKDVAFKPDADIEGARGIPGVVGLEFFYGLAMTEAERVSVYQGDKDVLRDLENRIIDTIVKFGDS